MKKREPTEVVAVRLDRDMAAWLAKCCNARRVNKSVIIRELILAAMGAK